MNKIKIAASSEKKFILQGEVSTFLRAAERSTFVFCLYFLTHVFIEIPFLSLEFPFTLILHLFP